MQYNAVPESGVIGLLAATSDLRAAHFLVTDKVKKRAHH